MGQYHHVVNLDKRQYLHPHKLGDGLKLMEFGASGGGTMMCLAILLADANGRGGGDFHGEDALVGSWAGDRIVIVGDYGDEGNFYGSAAEGTSSDETLMSILDDQFEDISDRIRAVVEPVEGMRERW